MEPAQARLLSPQRHRCRLRHPHTPRGPRTRSRPPCIGERWGLQAAPGSSAARGPHPSRTVPAGRPSAGTGVPRMRGTGWRWWGEPRCPSRAPVGGGPRSHPGTARVRHPAGSDPSPHRAPGDGPSTHRGEEPVGLTGQQRGAVGAGAAGVGRAAEPGEQPRGSAHRVVGGSGRQPVPGLGGAAEPEQQPQPEPPGSAHGASGSAALRGRRRRLYSRAGVPPRPPPPRCAARPPRGRSRSPAARSRFRVTEGPGPSTDTPRSRPRHRSRAQNDT